MARGEKLVLYSLHESGLNAVSGSIAGYVDFYGLMANNQSGSALYIQVYNTGSLPGSEATPVRSWQVAANSVLSLNFLEGKEYPNGLSYAWSNKYGTLGTGSFTQTTVDIEYKK